DVDADVEHGGEADPDDAPGEGFAAGDFVGIAVEDSEVDGQHAQHKDQEHGPGQQLKQHRGLRGWWWVWEGREAVRGGEGVRRTRSAPRGSGAPRTPVHCVAMLETKKYTSSGPGRSRNPGASKFGCAR